MTESSGEVRVTQDRETLIKAGAKAISEGSDGGETMEQMRDRIERAEPLSHALSMRDAACALDAALGSIRETDQ